MREGRARISSQQKDTADGALEKRQMMVAYSKMSESWTKRRLERQAFAGPNLLCSGAQTGFCKQEGSSRHFYLFVF